MLRSLDALEKVNGKPRAQFWKEVKARQSAFKEFVKVVGALTAEQQGLLLDVIGAWVSIAEADAAAARMEEIKKQVGDTYFAWKGPTAKGSAAYFRVQGPAVVIEYAPQGGTDHIHTVVRNPKDDYGAAEVMK